MNELNPRAGGGPTLRTPRKAPPAVLSHLGKVPPQAIELEMAVLGALMLEKDALSKVIDILQPEVFYKEGHKVIFEAIRELFQTSQPVDLLTVKEQLKRSGTYEIAGGSFALAELTAQVASAANIEYHARIIAQKHIQRELIRIAGEVQRDAYEETTDVFDLLDKAESDLFRLSETSLRRENVKIDDLVAKTIKQIEELRTREDGITGVSTGFRRLDELTSGWQPSDLIIIAARPAMGKTAFTLSVARNAAVKNGVPVAFFSLEMAAGQIAQRLLSAEAELDLSRLRTGKLEPYEFEQLTHRSNALVNAPLFINDTPALSLYDLRAKCRRLKAEKGIKLVIIDYLQLMSAGATNKAGNREQEIASISRGLKELAKELDVAVIALSQLSRAVETRGNDKRPQLSDLRESGSIEQDADVVAFLYRPEYYGFETDDEGNSTKGVAEVIIGKQRNGPTDTARLAFVGRFAKFADLEAGYDAGGSGYVPFSGFNNDPGPSFRPDSGGSSDANDNGPRFKTLPSRMNDDTFEGGFEPAPF